jgi:hypothetical protein
LSHNRQFGMVHFSPMDERFLCFRVTIKYTSSVTSAYLQKIRCSHHNSNNLTDSKKTQNGKKMYSGMPHYVNTTKLLPATNINEI